MAWLEPYHFGDKKELVHVVTDDAFPLVYHSMTGRRDDGTLPAKPHMGVPYVYRNGIYAHALDHHIIRSCRIFLRVSSEVQAGANRAYRKQTRLAFFSVVHSMDSDL